MKAAIAECASPRFPYLVRAFNKSASLAIPLTRIAVHTRNAPLLKAIVEHFPEAPVLILSNIIKRADRAADLSDWVALIHILPSSIVTELAAARFAIGDHKTARQIVNATDRALHRAFAAKTSATKWLAALTASATDPDITSVATVASTETIAFIIADKARFGSTTATDLIAAAVSADNLHIIPAIIEASDIPPAPLNTILLAPQFIDCFIAKGYSIPDHPSIHHALYALDDPALLEKYPPADSQLSIVAARPALAHFFTDFVPPQQYASDIIRVAVASANQSVVSALITHASHDDAVFAATVAAPQIISLFLPDADLPRAADMLAATSSTDAATAITSAFPALLSDPDVFAHAFAANAPFFNALPWNITDLIESADATILASPFDPPVIKKAPFPSVIIRYIINPERNIFCLVSPPPEILPSITTAITDFSKVHSGALDLLFAMLLPISVHPETAFSQCSMSDNAPIFLNFFRKYISSSAVITAIKARLSAHIFWLADAFISFPADIPFSQPLPQYTPSATFDSVPYERSIGSAIFDQYILPLSKDPYKAAAITPYLIRARISPKHAWSFITAGGSSEVLPWVEAGYHFFP